LANARIDEFRLVTAVDVLQDFLASQPGRHGQGFQHPDQKFAISLNIITVGLGPALVGSGAAVRGEDILDLLASRERHTVGLQIACG